MSGRTRAGVAAAAVIACAALVLIGLRGCRYVRARRSKVLVIAESDLPFESGVKLRKGDAVRLLLPNSREVAFWCVKGEVGVFAPGDAELMLRWGEKPFRVPRLKDIPRPDGSFGVEFDSYIRSGGINPSAEREGAELMLYVDDYCVLLAEGRISNGMLPVSVAVRAVSSTNNGR